MSLSDRMVTAGMQGVECLAGIPGSVGGTPVQNVGAYGQEVAETIVSVRALTGRRGSLWNSTGRPASSAIARAYSIRMSRSGTL